MQQIRYYFSPLAAQRLDRRLLVHTLMLSPKHAYISNENACLERDYYSILL